LFDDTYVNFVGKYKLKSYREESLDENHVNVQATLLQGEELIQIVGEGNGLLDAFCHGLSKVIGDALTITTYHEHAMQSGSDSAAITYVEIQRLGDGKYLGCGISSSVTKSSLRAVISAVNRMLAE
jgi:2-isopropylmalate synthase